MKQYTIILLFLACSAQGFTYPFKSPNFGEKLQWVSLTNFCVQQGASFGHVYDVSMVAKRNNKASIIMKTTNRYQITLDLESLLKKQPRGKSDYITDDPRIPSNLFSLIYSCYQIIVRNPEKKRDCIRVELYAQIYEHA